MKWTSWQPLWLPNVTSARLHRSSAVIHDVRLLTRQRKKIHASQADWNSGSSLPAVTPLLPQKHRHSLAEQASRKVWATNNKLSETSQHLDDLWWMCWSPTSKNIPSSILAQRHWCIVLKLENIYFSEAPDRIIASAPARGTPQASRGTSRKVAA